MIPVVGLLELAEPGQVSAQRRTVLDPLFRQVDGDVLFLFNRSNGVELFVGTSPHCEDGAIHPACY
ncbi:MAG TPA: hypothetical protein VMS21_00880 [Methylomirabilota bacterium]|nr:hypothetical protein [Methylomirabilota bacterium]